MTDLVVRIPSQIKIPELISQSTGKTLAAEGCLLWGLDK
jgi:hypothetical protein